jgi:hypothetical protein
MLTLPAHRARCGTEDEVNDNDRVIPSQRIDNTETTLRDQSMSLWPTTQRKGVIQKGIARRRSPRFTYNRRSLVGSTHLTAMNNSTSPRTIYLPSSGGYTNSRIVPEVGSSARR